MYDVCNTKTELRTLYGATEYGVRSTEWHLLYGIGEEEWERFEMLSLKSMLSRPITEIKHQIEAKLACTVLVPLSGLHSALSAVNSVLCLHSSQLWNLRLRQG